MGRMIANEKEQADYDELCFYTRAHGSPSFIHQHVVDAYAAQHADESTKPISVAFALIGLYLYIERNYSGKEVQRAHMALTKRRKFWPRFKIPTERGRVTVSYVIAAPAGNERDNLIRQWCASVWAAWRESHEEVRKLVQTEMFRNFR
jgi:hypothetical protein